MRGTFDNQRTAHRWLPAMPWAAPISPCSTIKPDHGRFKALPPSGVSGLVLAVLAGAALPVVLTRSEPPRGTDDRLVSCAAAQYPARSSEPDGAGARAAR